MMRSTRILAVLTCAAFLPIGHAVASTLYCAQTSADQWSLQRFKPLIKVGGGTVFTEITFAGNAVQAVKLRRFYPGWTIAFEYRFDGQGRMTALLGSVLVDDPVIMLEGDTGPPQTTQWLAEADLTPGPDRKIPQHHTRYSRDKDQIDKPENADKYLSHFEEAPIYRTIQAVPCAAMMKEAERLNATQE